MLIIVVIDYDMGNLYFVCKGLEKVGVILKIIDFLIEIDKVDVVILLGVGFFDLVV